MSRTPKLVPLAIDPFLPRIVDSLRNRRTLVLSAPPGTGKSTRVPPALLASDPSGGPILMLQPRRVAARAIARRIAEEQGWTIGEEVGWQIRFERRFGPATRILVATEGILTARLQADPLLSAFRTVILDEVHERSLHMDLALALVRQALHARDDLRCVAMSATLDAGPLAAFLDAAVIELDATAHPVTIDHAPDQPIADAVRDAAAATAGHVLCFLPGRGDIHRLQGDLAGRLPGTDILPLHGGLDPAEQDRALAPSERRKCVVATNIAETSLTVEGVTTVIDSGWHKVLRHDPRTGLDRLVTERVSQDSADQRAGRAGRTGPGRAVRLWHPHQRLRERREPEIERVDLAASLLEVIAWGDDPRTFDWFEAPPDAAVAAGLELLERLGAVAAGRLTEVGQTLRRLPLHPRLGRLLVAASGDRRAAAMCACVSEGDIPRRPGDSPGDVATTDSDLLSQVDRLALAPARVKTETRALEGLVGRLGLGASPGRTGNRAATDDQLRRAILTAFPDRVAERREPNSPLLKLASGGGARLGRTSGVREGRYLVAVSLDAAAGGPAGEALVHLASRVEPEWLTPDRTEVVHSLDFASGKVRAVERKMLGELVLGSRPVGALLQEAEKLLREHLLSRGLGTGELGENALGEEVEATLRRMAVAGIEVDRAELIARACRGQTELPRIDPLRYLSHDEQRRLRELAPVALKVPSGRDIRLQYRQGGAVVLPVKLQELFGLDDGPRIGGGRIPVTLELLAPNGRPVQSTSDLASFWQRTYPEVRRELRGRYPKHPWPEDPSSAPPTARTTRRASK